MHETDIDPNEDELEGGSEPAPVIDFDNDEVQMRMEEENDGALEDDYPDDHERRIENADLDNATDEFVDMVNARDLDGLAELLAPDVESDFLGGMSREEVVDGLHDLLFRYPTLLTTRADLGPEPLVAVWTFDNEADRFDQFGFFTFEMTEEGEGLVRRIGYADELPDSDDLIVETPERSDLPEWEDWSELDED